MINMMYVEVMELFGLSKQEKEKKSQTGSAYG